jgi:hypothetical protein
LGDKRVKITQLTFDFFILDDLFELEKSFSFLGEAGGITLEPNCLNSRADPMFYIKRLTGKYQNIGYPILNLACVNT